MNEETVVLSLEDVRARVKARQESGIDVGTLETFHHEGLGGNVYLTPLPSFAMSRYENIEQYYPLDHTVPALRGTKASSNELDELNRHRLVLEHGVRLADGKPLGKDIVEFLLNDELSGPCNRDLALKILGKTFARDAKATPDTAGLDTVAAYTRWDAAFKDLLVKSGWVGHWVEYVTSNDESTPEAKEAAQKLAKVAAAAPEWAKQMQAEEIANALIKEDA